MPLGCNKEKQDKKPEPGLTPGLLINERKPFWF